MDKAPLKSLVAILVILAEISAEITNYLYAPGFPFILKEFSTTQSQVQFTIQLALLFFGIASLVYGFIARLFSYKNFFLFALGVSIIGNSLSCFAYNIDMLCFARILKAIGASAILVIGRIMITATFKREKDVAGIFAFMLITPGLEIFLAPLGGYISTNFGWRYVFCVPLCMEIFLFIVVLFFLKTDKEPLQKNTFQLNQTLKNYLSTLKSKGFLTYSLVYALVSSIYWSYLITAPFLFHSLGISGSIYGFYIAPNTIGYLLGILANKFLMRRFNSKQLFLKGLWLLFLAGLIFNFITFFLPYSPLALSISFGMITFSMALIYPNATQNSMQSPSTSKETASALLAFLEMSSIFIFTTLLTTRNCISRESISVSILIVASISLCLITFQSGQLKRQGLRMKKF
jgi:DHA1 family bicyclomycin/chloramphenicol resistance-like MFS transporter